MGNLLLVAVSRESFELGTHNPQVTSVTPSLLVLTCVTFPAVGFCTSVHYALWSREQSMATNLLDLTVHLSKLQSPFGICVDIWHACRWWQAL